MKTPLFSILLAVAALARAAQPDPFATIARQCNAMLPGDSFDMTEIPVTNHGARGTGQIWHIPVNLDGTDHRRTYLMKGDTLVCLEYPEYLTYDISSDTLRLASVENRETRVDYDLAPPVIRFPMAYGDSVFSRTSGRGLYGKRIYIGHRGEAYSVADGTGILTDGTDTLRHVLRVHTRHEYRRVMSPNKTQVEAWMAEDAVGDSLPVFSEDRYSWYRAGTRYPVMECFAVTASFHCDTVLTKSVTLLYTPDLQRTDLGADPENHALLARISMSGDNASPDDGTPCMTDGFPATVDAVLGIDRNMVNVTLTLDTKADVRLGVFDSLGRGLSAVTKLSVAPGIHRECLTMTSAPIGNTLLTVWINDANMTFKVRTE